MQYTLGEKDLARVRAAVQAHERRNGSPPIHRPRRLGGGGQQYRRVKFELPSAITDTTVSVSSCTVVRVMNGPDPGATIDILNDLGWTGDAGGYGYASYDYGLAEWVIDILQCAAAS